MDQQPKNQALPQTTLKKQPVICPWTANQPYPSTLPNKNRNVAPGSSTLTNHISNSHWPNVPISTPAPKLFDKNQAPPMQHSSSQFFYFLRLMELFPETHPATLHTVLTLCKNNFFCAVDKLLYAKRCKAMYNRRQTAVSQRYAQVGRTHPYSGGGVGGGGGGGFGVGVGGKTASVKSECCGGAGNQVFATGDGDVTVHAADGGRIETTLQQLAQSRDQQGGADILREAADGSLDDEIMIKDEEDMSSPSDMQQQLKVPLKPLSPVSESAEDLTAPSPPTKIKAILQD